MVLLVYSIIAWSDGFKSEEETRAFSDAFVEQLVAEHFQQGFDAAKPHWPIPVVEIDSIVNKVNQQWPIVRQRFGDPIGKEFICEKRIGTSFLQYYYLHKFEKHAIYWRIDFYKPIDEWKINSVAFLDDLGPLYE